eukprot:TRINITY_DN4893_c0_g1_i1.p1 TRINITY_DN4893_c0_g1~~TRINITY_DN4893_c0_g1_i1.p1  ORF type:complete len:415 (+),score=66.41 TRINITY_DN4893_c0_g1_i1:119-1363(+)
MERLRCIFNVDSHYLGSGPVLFSWHPSGQFIACCGSVCIVYVFDGRGRLADQISLCGSSPCICLEWDAEGRTLAMLQGGGSREILLWDLETKEVERIELNVRDTTFMKWSKRGKQLAIGTAKGDVLIYDRTKSCWYPLAKHKKRITCGDWNNDNKFAFASDDRQIMIASSDGKVYGQVKVKSKPTNVKFGGRDPNRQDIVSVSMDRKTILLYSLEDPENALELAFQQRYGYIVAFEWFRDGFIIVGFSLGYVVVISTDPSEIGREQFCQRFHKDSLHNLAYSPRRHRLVTCSPFWLKVIDMNDWKELYSEEIDSTVVGPLDKLQWDATGRCFSVSTKEGCLLVFSTDPASALEHTLPEASSDDVKLSMTERLYQPLSTTLFLFCILFVLVMGLLLASRMFNASPFTLISLLLNV